MKKHPSESRTPAPAAKLTAAATAKLMRYALWLALLAPLIDTLIIFPLRQIVLANVGAGVVFQLLFQATELFNLVTFFLLMALAIYCALADAPRVLGRIVALHGIASFFVVILLRLGLYCLMAWIDAQYVFPFSLCNQTLNTLLRNSGAELMSLALSLFISQVVLFALLGVTALLSLRVRQKALSAGTNLSPASLAKQFDASPLPRMLRIGLILYTLFALGNQVFDTVSTVINLGAPDGFSSLLSLIIPYFLLAIYTLICYLALDYGTRYIAREAAI